MLNSNRNFFLFFLRKLSFLFNIYMITIYLNNYLLISIIISYLIDRIFWDIITTWYYVDIIQGSIVYFEKKFIKYNIYKWLILLELIIKNYRECLNLLLNNIKIKNIDYKFNIKNINIINLVINILIFSYNNYLFIHYYFIKNINIININKPFSIINYKIKTINNIINSRTFIIYIKFTFNFFKIIFIWLYSKIIRIKSLILNYKLNLIPYKYNFNRYIKSFMHFKKFDDMNNKLIPISTLETNLVISLAIVETNIYTFHIFNLTIAHNLDVYINNELGDEDMIESSIEDIGDWKECFDEYIEYKLINLTDPIILNVFVLSKLLNKKLDDVISYYCKNYDLVIYDFIIFLIDRVLFLSKIYTKLYYLIYKYKYIDIILLLKADINIKYNYIILVFLNGKFFIKLLYFNLYHLDITNYFNFIFNKFNYVIYKLYMLLKIIERIKKNIVSNALNILISIKKLNKPVDELLLGIEIYYVNSKLPWKILKNKLKLFIIKHLDYLEYCMLSHKFYNRRNIKKYYKKKYNPIKIKNELNDKILILYDYIYKYIFNLLIKIKKYYFSFYDKIYNYCFIINYFKLNQYIYIETYVYFYIKEMQILCTNIIVYNYLIKLFYDLNSVLSALILISYPNNVIRDIKKINSYSFNLNLDWPVYNYINLNFLSTSLRFKNIINTLINLYLPIFIINYILSDIAISFNTLNKKYKISSALFSDSVINYIIFFKLFFKKFKKLLFLILTNIYSKTIYITFLVSYFFNRYFIDYLYFDIYLRYISIFKFKYKYIISVIELFINWNSLIVIFSLSGILLVLKWSRSVHRFFGYFFWTLIVFPVFMETHRTLYTKLLLSNYLNIDSIGFVLITKFNLLSVFNYKLYNFFFLSSFFIFLFFFIYTIKQGAFRHIYANFKATRWKYIKYPIYICSLELIRLKFVEIICIYLLYMVCKYKFYLYSYSLCLKFNHNYIITVLLNFIRNYIFEFENPENYYIFYTMLVPNPFFINLIIDFTLFLISLNWVLTYCREFKNSDKKFVAFPLYVSEIFYSYILKYYICYYLLINLLVWINDGKLIWYGTQSLFVLFLYLDIRVNKIPKKTMAWYFRQIVDLWPLTCSMLWTTPKYLYQDQQKYLSMRQKLRIPKKNFKILYNRAERWEKKIIFTFQRDKEIELYKFTAFCRLMSRKENMLREFNVFDYQGWQEDWTFCYKKINIFNWKLDWWDKPYIYLFKKLIYLTNMQICYFSHFPIMYRFSCKFNHFNGIHNIVKFFDYFYSNIYIFNYDNELKYNHLFNLFFKRKKYKLSCIDWKLNAHSKFDEKEELIHLKKLKIVLMEFSCGLRDKTPDWVFPSVYEKQYKKDGWKMFEDSRIDSVPLDWRPKIHKW